jgi:predicted dehydrogenase
VIKELVEHDAVGTPLSFTYHSGQYLPDWHPWEDYRSYYVAKRATGACREIVPFELIWLTWVLGDVETVSCFRGKLSALDADIDDTYQLLLRFKRGILGHMLVDVVSRVPYRTYRLLGEEGVIDWVWSEKKVRVFKADSRTWTEYSEPAGIAERGYLAAEDMYIEEMRQFVEAVQGVRDYPYTLAEDKRVLDLLRAAEQSSVEGKHVHLG